MIPALKKLLSISVEMWDVSQATHKGSKTSSLGKAWHTNAMACARQKF